MSSPRIRWVLPRYTYLAAMAFAVIGLAEVFQARRMGTAAERVDASEIRRLGWGGRWVAVSGLRPDCSRVAQRLKNGKVVDTMFLATDAAKRLRLVLRTSGDAKCDAEPPAPIVGILDAPFASEASLLTQAGIYLDHGHPPLFDLAVGRSPAETAHLGWVFGGLSAVIAISVFISRRG